MAEDRGAQVYTRLRTMVERFDLKPESQINEVALAKKFGTSRTPVREALNRLVAEGYLTFQARRGFFVRPFNPDEVLSLYETRVAIETEATRMAILRKTTAELESFAAGLDAIAERHQDAKDLEELLGLDEDFHLAIARATGNPEFERILTNLNSRIRFFRLIDLQNKLSHSKDRSARQAPNHKAVAQAIGQGDVDKAVLVVRQHIERNREEAKEAVTRAFAAIYFADETDRNAD
ncbi:GntR family transcriptional regulator [Polycladidibacter hongkongensis]|uniref:GntR family transcriptional regulator n=1 Tax=Polycladidibacter hongkongensis TaxID=1647556 RepID=UPI00082E46E9|nr:GntR family transcriptional regulator [Pseudovibrio hongkongensis]